MFATLNRLGKFLRSSGIKKTGPLRRLQPQFEQLEARDNPALVFYTDMTQLASAFPTHAGATMLYLNFDGNTAQGVSSFQAISSDRNGDIHDILFRTQQIFAPFNVTVQRMYGAGAMGTGFGSTTLFIGDYATFGTGTSNNDGAVTPWASSDFPGTVRGVTHVPNSDATDMGFVDPIYRSGSSNVSNSTTWIAQAAAHEAGHTFGLVHVTTTAMQPDVMSYDTTNARFMNQSFAISDRNYDASTGRLINDISLVPHYFHVDYLTPYTVVPHTDRLVTQNSYTYLAVTLGMRSTTELANVADSSSVDSAYRDGTKIKVAAGSTYTSTLTVGDWDVFSYTATASRYITINAKQASGSSVDPVLLAYDSNGSSLLGFNDDSNGTRNSQVTIQVRAGQTYQFAVGSYGARSSGNYTLSVTEGLLVDVRLSDLVNATAPRLDPVRTVVSRSQFATSPLIQTGVASGVAMTIREAPAARSIAVRATDAAFDGWDSLIEQVFASRRAM